MKKIAITGTIASGKSTLSELLRNQNYEVFDADNYAKLCLVKPHPAVRDIVKAFGEGILNENGEIDKSKLAYEIFGNNEKRIVLNGIIHPCVKEGLLKFFRTYENEQFVFAEVPLLYEVGWENLFDYCIVVSCSKDTAIERMMKNRGYTAEQANARLASQINSEDQIRKADKVFMNDGTVNQLRTELNRWLESIGC